MYQNNNKQLCSQTNFDFIEEKALMVQTTFVYLKKNFLSFLSRSSISTELTNFVDEIRTYCFISMNKFYVNVATTRRELGR